MATTPLKIARNANRILFVFESFLLCLLISLILIDFFEIIFILITHFHMIVMFVSILMTGLMIALMHLYRIV